MENAPPIVIDRRRNIGEILSDSIQLYTQNFLPLLAIAAIYLPVQMTLGRSMRVADSNSALSWPAICFELVLLGVVQFVITGAIALRLLDLERGMKLKAINSYAGLRNYLQALLGAGLRVSLITIGFLLTIVGSPWGMNRVVRWLLVPQVVVAEQVTGQSALARSSELVHGHWWNTAGRYLVVILATLTMTIGVPASGIFSGSWFIHDLLQASLVAVVLPFSAIATTLIYFDLRQRQQAALPIPETDSAVS